MAKRPASPLGWLLGAGIMLATPAVAAPVTPHFTRAQVYELFAVAGFPAGQNRHPINRCGEPANPKVTFVDLNDDHRLEALFIDAGSCYKPDGLWFAVLTQQANGEWRRILDGEGILSTTGAKYAGWFALNVTSTGKTTHLRYNGEAYVANGQPPATTHAPHEAAAKAPDRAASGPDTAIFLAADLKRIHGHWESGCNEGNTDPNDPYQPAAIVERKDLNGDGRKDAIIAEGGVFCYGNTGQAFWIVAQEANGHWKLMINAIGIADFRKTKGVDGWPDILIGGPGMCFPIVRWNGAAYKTVAFNDGEKPCSPMR